MTRRLVAGGIATGVVIVLMGCGGSIGSSPNDAGTGIVLSPPPPFAISAAPASAAFEACDALSPPRPIGFLADGRAVVGQRVATDRVVPSTLVRAWDPRTNTLERLFVASSSDVSWGDILRISHDGSRIFDATNGQLRVYDVDRRALLSDTALPATVEAVSDGGAYVLDGELRRYTASGEADFDFKPLVPADVRYLGPGWFPPALSFSGDAVAAVAVDPVTSAVLVLVLYQDGRVVRLADPPVSSSCNPDQCGMSWSADGLHLLHYAVDSLRVWEVATARLIARLDADVSSAAFAADGRQVVTRNHDGYMVERDLSGAATFTWTIAGDPRIAFGPQGKLLGSDSSDLVVATRGGIEARWRQPAYAWPAALAVTSSAAFAIVFDWESPPSEWGFFLMLARFELDRPGPTAVLRAKEFQSEWVGQVALSPDEQRVAAVFPDTTRILDAATLAPLAVIPSGAGTIAWSPDGRYLAATPDLHYRDPGRSAFLPGKEVTVWNASSATLAARFSTAVYPKAIAFDEQGRTLVGWGQPILEDLVHQPADPSLTLHSFYLDGAAAGFAIDLATSTVSAADLPPFVGATRELLATENSIVRVSSGTTLSAIRGLSISYGTFSADFSLLLAVGKAPDGSLPVRLVNVERGTDIAEIPTTVGPYPTPPALAVSRAGHLVAAPGGFYCAK